MVYEQDLSKRRGVSIEHCKGDGCVWEPSDAKASSPDFLLVSDTILIREIVFLPQLLTSHGGAMILHRAGTVIKLTSNINFKVISIGLT